MKRLIIVLICSFVPAAILLAQTGASQATTATTTQKTSATTAKTSASKTSVHKNTTATTAKSPTANTAASKPGSTAASKTATTTASKAVVSKTPVSSQWITTASGLKYQEVVVGKGLVPKPGDDILVNYTGRFELHLGRGEVIKGWDEALSTMHVGGKRKLIIPPGLAYGPGGYPGVIPPNSTLNFDVELLKIK